MTHCTKKFLGLKDENITLVKDWLEERLIKGEKVHIIKASLTYQPKACLKCGLVNQGEIVKNGTHTIQAQLLPYRNQRTILELKKTRFLCRACGCTFNAQTPLIEENCQLSKELVYKIAHDLKRNLSRKDIAAMNFVSDATVQRVLRRVTNWFRPNFKFLPTGCYAWMNSVH